MRRITAKRLASLCVLAALLAGCDSKIVNRPGSTRPTGIVASTPGPQVEATPAPVQSNAAGGPTPCPNGVVPPPTPDLIWCDGGPGCQPTPDYKPAQHPCATNAEIDAWLQGGQP